MRKEVIHTIYDSISKGTQIGIGQLYTEDEFYDKTTITIGNSRHVNFGSYSYLGLEHDQRLKDAAIDAIKRYGIQYPSSRTYVSSTLYGELEKLLGDIFKKPVILATTTTLAHVAVMPIVVNEGDVVLMDQQVHSSVQFMISHLQLQGIPFHVVRHNSLESIERQIKELSQKHNNVWYMMDGIYSMYGDPAPMKELHELMDKYPKFRLYVDDAHGMSWSGPNGSGYALEYTPFHEQMVLVTSLNKAFAAGGAVVVIPDPKVREMARTCGGPFIFAGQLQMSALGAGIACAKIHLSEEIKDLQADLKMKIAFCESQLMDRGLPFIQSKHGTPIFFVAVGLSRLGYNLVQRMMQEGFYVNLAIFPAVSITRTGIRFSITCNHTLEQIEALVATLAVQFEETLIEEERTIEDIYHAFRKTEIYKPTKTKVAPIVPMRLPNFQIQHETRIETIPKEVWNTFMHDKGSYDWDGLRFLENVYRNNKEEHDNWEFNYFIVRNVEGKIVLCTYMTACMVKDDALVPALISQQIEQKRQLNPYYLCSKTLMLGCPISIGDHLYIDKSSADWEAAFSFFMEKITSIFDQDVANVLQMRDIAKTESKLHESFESQGFVKVDVFDGYAISLNGINSADAFLQRLKSDRRRFVRHRAIENSDQFEVRLLGSKDMHLLEAVYQLYLNTKEKHVELNLFDCPKDLFRQAIPSPDWDVLVLSLRADSTNKPIGLALNVKSGSNYNFIFAGLDYRFVESHDTYNQLLWQIVLRAILLGSSKIDLGLTTRQNKRKFGANDYSSVSFVQVKDDFNYKIISSMVNYDSNMNEISKMQKKRITSLESHFGVQKAAGAS
ncbi:MAG: GNAT family N-acetyltransferase [Flavobacteriales bacterium]|nr:GNAT family N-acetyltransferase [Flavobacteriales bacterium]